MKDHTSTARSMLRCAVFRLVPACFVAALSIVLAACGGSSSSSSSSPPASNSILVASATNSHVSLNGVWRACSLNGAGGISDQAEVLTVSGASISFAITDYSSIDLSCTKTATPQTSPPAATISAVGDKTALGWSDGSGNTTVPNATGGGLLAATPTVTKITDGATLKTIFFIDDTGTPWRMYLDCNTGGCTVDVSGYPDYLEANLPSRFVKQ